MHVCYMVILLNCGDWVSIDSQNEGVEIDFTDSYHYIYRNGEFKYKQVFIVSYRIIKKERNLGLFCTPCIGISETYYFSIFAW